MACQHWLILICCSRSQMTDFVERKLMSASALRYSELAYVLESKGADGKVRPLLWLAVAVSLAC